jgi:septation ring formation regulator
MDGVKSFLLEAWSFIRAHLSVEVMIYIAIAVLLLIIISIVSRVMKQKKAAKRLSALEIEVNEIRNNQLAYKYNKAAAFARSNPDIMDRVNKLKPKYDICQKSISSCDEAFVKADDYIGAHKIKKAMRLMDELETMLDQTKERIRIVDQSLDHILARETEVREKSNALKERFRGVKQVYQDNRASFYSSSAYVEAQLQSIEDEFSNFEEWMFASEFNKAKEEVDKIASRVDGISSQIAAFPGLYDRAKARIPQSIDEIQGHLMGLENAGIDISYLNAKEKLASLSMGLVNAVNQLDGGNVEDGTRSLDYIEKELQALKDEVLQEKKAYEEIHTDLNATFAMVDESEKGLQDIMNLYANIKDRFGLEDWSRKFRVAEGQLDELKRRRKDLAGRLKEDDAPKSDVVHTYRDFAEDVMAFHGQVKNMKQMLTGASSDENRARKQLVKLQLILNEVRLNTVSRHLPSISDQFAQDLKEGEEKIARVRKVLDHSPLDVKTLNADLQDAIDFVYRLYNNANNLVGVAVMVENAIVFGNRFRSSYPDMDSDLTRAEICFQNGEYTRALKIAIQAIENMHPGIYEKLIARKDPAVMNQAG